MRLPRPRKTPDASQSPVVTPGETKRARAVDRLIAAESARVVPSESKTDDLAEITDEDITHAVTEWDDAQTEADTGLDGLLDARLAE